VKTEKLLGIIFTGLALQFTNAVLSIVKVPIMIHALGPTKFIDVAVFISFWSYLTFQSEANRKYSRTHFASDGLWVKSVGINIGLLPIVVMAILMYLKFQKSFTFLALVASISSMGIASLISVATANSIGVLEASGRIRLVNGFMILNQLITFPLFLLATLFAETFLVLLAYLFSYIGGGVALLFYTNSIFPRRDRAYTELQNNVWPEIVFWELLPSAFFPYIVSISCSEGEVLKYLIYQKFVIIYASLPVALGPLNSIMEFRDNRLILRERIMKINFVFVASCGCIIIFFHEYLVSLLSQGAVGSDFLILSALVLSGSVGVFVSAEINRATTGKSLKMRLLSLRFFTIMCLMTLFISSGKLGPSMPFFLSAFLSIAIFLAIRSVRKNAWM